MMWSTQSRRSSLFARSRARRLVPALFVALLIALLGAAPASAGSQTWTRIGLKGIAASAVAVSPTNPSVLIAGGGEAAADATKEGKVHFYRSADRGKTWTTVTPAIKFGVIAGWSNTTVHFIQYDPKDANVVYADVVSSGFEGDLNKGTGLYRSADGGKTWKLVYEGDVVNLAVSPASPSTLYLAASRGIEPGCYSGNCATPVAGNGPEIAKSTDRGLTWTHLTESQRGQYVAVSPTNASALLVGGNSPTDLYLLRVSADGGKTWTGVRALDGWISHPAYARSGSILYAAFMSQGCALGTRTGCKASVVRSTDGGRTWDTGYTVGNPAPTFEIETVLPDRLSDGVAFVATRNAGSTPSFSVLRSADRGATLSPLGSTFQGLSDLALDGANPETLYAATSDGVWAYTLPKAAATATPTKGAPATATAATAKATATTPPAPTATAAPAVSTPLPTATSAAKPSPTAQASATPTAKPPIAQASPVASATPTPQSEVLSDRSTLPETVGLVGAGAALLAVGTLLGRRLSRR